MIQAKFVNANPNQEDICNEPIEALICNKKVYQPSGMFIGSQIITTRVSVVTINKLLEQIYWNDVNVNNFNSDWASMAAGKASLEGAINTYVPSGEQADRLQDLSFIYQNMQQGFTLWNSPEMKTEEAQAILEAISTQLNVDTKQCSFTPNG